MGKSLPAKDGSTGLRLFELVRDAMQAGESAGAALSNWAQPDYAEAAKACLRNPEDLDKLWLLTEDLEYVVRLDSGPASILRTAGVLRKSLAVLEGRTWREVLLDETLESEVWAALRSYARALKSAHMDAATRRLGLVIHAVSMVRLETRGKAELDAESEKKHAAEREFLLGKPYLPAFLLRILKNKGPRARNLGNQ